MGQEIPHSSAPEPGRSDQRTRWFRWLVWSLLLSVLISGITSHFLSYHYGRIALNDSWASLDVPRNALAETYNHAMLPQQNSLSTSWTHFTIGGIKRCPGIDGRPRYLGRLGPCIPSASSSHEFQLHENLFPGSPSSLAGGHQTPPPPATAVPAFKRGPPLLH